MLPLHSSLPIPNVCAAAETASLVTLCIIHSFKTNRSMDLKKCDASRKQSDLSERWLNHCVNRWSHKKTRQSDIRANIQSTNQSGFHLNWKTSFVINRIWVRLMSYSGMWAGCQFIKLHHQLSFSPASSANRNSNHYIS